MNINITIYEGNNTLNVSDYTPTVTLTVVENLYQSGGGGAVNSVNGKTGTVVLGANDINESSTRFWLTDVLKSAYDGAVSGLANKVDKVTGYGLSKNDLTDLLKSTYDGYASQISAKANVSEVAIVLFKSITPTIITGKTVETSIYAIPLPTDGFDYAVSIYSQAQISTFSGAAIYHRLRIGTYSSPIDGASGADAIGNQTLIATYSASSGVQMPITRKLIFRGGTSGSIYGMIASFSVADDANSAATFTTLATKDFTTQHYLYVTFNPSVVGANVRHNQILVTLIKI